MEIIIFKVAKNEVKEPGEAGEDERDRDGEKEREKRERDSGEIQTACILTRSGSTNKVCLTLAPPRLTLRSTTQNHPGFAGRPTAADTASGSDGERFEKQQSKQSTQRPLGGRSFCGEDTSY